MTDAPVPSSSSGTPELRPCPFCGTAANVADTGACWVRCNNHECCAEGPVADDKYEAMEKWNARVEVSGVAQPPTELQREIDRLRGELDRSRSLLALILHTEVSAAQPPANPDAVKMYADALDAANKRIAELEAREWQRLHDPVMPIDPPHQAISAAMKEIPEDGCEYEHIEAAYRAIRASLVSSTEGK